MGRLNIAADLLDLFIESYLISIAAYPCTVVSLASSRPSFAIRKHIFAKFRAGELEEKNYDVT